MRPDRTQIRDDVVLALAPDGTLYRRCGNSITRALGRGGSLVDVVRAAGGRLDRTTDVFAAATRVGLSPEVVVQALARAAALSAAAPLDAQSSSSVLDRARTMLRPLQMARWLASDPYLTSTPDPDPARTRDATPVKGETVVAIVDDYGSEKVERLVRDHLGAGATLVLTRMRSRPVLGPTFGRRSSICAECFFGLVRTNDLRSALAQATTGVDLHVCSAVHRESIERWLELLSECSHAAVAAVLQGGGVITGGESPSTAPLVGRPDCPRCAKRPSRIVTVDPEFGTVRALMVEEPSPRLRIAQAHFALTTDPPPLKTPTAVRYWLDAVAEGKGSDATAAVKNAMGEVVERVCGCFHAGVAVRWHCYREIRDQTISPHSLLHWSAEQYARRVEDNPTCSRHNRVPPPFRDDVLLPWVAARDQLTGTDVLVPAGYAYTNADALLSVPSGHHMFIGTSNGCAAATTLRTAIERGLLEVIERDAVAIWWYNRIPRPPMATAGEDAVVGDVAQTFHEAGRNFWILDLTHDAGVAVAAAIASLRSPRDRSSQVIVGFGAGWSAHDAARRASLEAVQFLPKLSSLGIAGNQFARHEPDARRWWSTVLIDDAPWLCPAGASASVQANVRDVDVLMGRLRDLGSRTLVVDQSQERFRMRVARVIVPGLRHFWRQLGPGRLYDVPVQLGWLREPCAESQVNPFSVFF